MTDHAAYIRQFRLDIHHELIVDGFAGGGGMSEAIKEALGREPDIAFNHNAEALSMHRVNHPQTQHYMSDALEICPRATTRGRRVGLFHLSPDCTHHSQAAGGQPRDKKIRALSWVGVRWAGQVRPRIITLENVKPILAWGPLVAKRDPATKRVIKRDGTVAAPGEHVPVREQFLVPDKRRAGETWRKFVRILTTMGYKVEWKPLVAADYGAPTTRERLFMVARCDRKPIVWPEPTHTATPVRGKKRWREAAECIDWSIRCPSIFERERPLADATLRRVAKGIRRYVLDADDPFLVPAAHVAAQLGGTRAAAYLEQANTGMVGHDLREPLSTIVGKGCTQRLVTAYLAHFRGNCDARELREPLRTLSAGGKHHGLVQCMLAPEQEAGAVRVAAFLMRYYGTGGQLSDLRDPMATITTKDRLALVTVTVQGQPYVIVDIGLRMLTPPELYLAQGFQSDYIISRGHDGRRFTRTAQVRMVGNSVSPPPARALIAANAADLAVATKRVA